MYSNHNISSDFLAPNITRKNVFTRCNVRVFFFLVIKINVLAHSCNADRNDRAGLDGTH